MSTLPTPEFVRVDPADVETQLVKRYEEMSGKTLYPAQIERQLINQIAYADGLIRAAIQAACEKMLVRTSSGVFLDYLGDLVGTPRLAAAPAQVDIVFTPNSPINPPTMLPAGTVVASADGRVSFATTEAIEVGANPVAVAAICTEAGEAGNGWLPGQINAQSTGLPVVASNTTISTGGANVETDERYRERIISAPESYTNAGSYGVYRHHAMSVHQSIVDVAVLGPTEGEPPGQVAVVPLIDTGLPDAMLLAQVQTTLSADTVRPLCDTVVVRAPVAVPYSVNVTLTLYESADAVLALQSAQTALQAYLTERTLKLGVDLVPEQIAAVCQVPGVYRAVVNQPTLQVLEIDQWGQCMGVAVTVAGAVHG